MKINANAGVLARALALAASLDPGKRPSAALEAVSITSGDGAVTLTRNVLNHQIYLLFPPPSSTPAHRRCRARRWLR